MPTADEQLSNALHDRISALSEQGDALAERDDYAAAVGKYREALALLPEPVVRWEAATWLLGSIGDAHFLAGQHEQARLALSEAMRCPGALGNPFLHLRLGQAQYELGNLERANDELARAYMGAGSEIFDEEDPKYLAHLKTVLEAPPGGW